METSQVQQQSLLNSNYSAGSLPQISTTVYNPPEFIQGIPELFGDSNPITQNPLTDIIGKIMETLVSLVDKLISALTKGNLADQPVRLDSQAQTSTASEAVSTSDNSTATKEESFFDKIGGYIKKGVKVYETVSDLFGFKTEAKDTAKKVSGKASEWLEKAGNWAKSAGEKVGSWLNTAGDYAAKAGNWLADSASSIGSWVSGLFA